MADLRVPSTHAPRSKEKCKERTDWKAGCPSVPTAKDQQLAVGGFPSSNISPTKKQTSTIADAEDGIEMATLELSPKEIAKIKYTVYPTPGKEDRCFGCDACERLIDTDIGIPLGMFCNKGKDPKTCTERSL